MNVSGRSGSENLEANSMNLVSNSVPVVGLILKTPVTGGPLIRTDIDSTACLAISLKLTATLGGRLKGARTKLKIVEL